MTFASGFSWFHLIFPEAVGNDGIAEALGEGAFGATLSPGISSIVPHAWLACFVVIILALFARRGLNQARAKNDLEQYFADEGVTARNFFELITEAWVGLMSEMMHGPRYAKIYFPVIGSYFMYILISNLMALVPGLLAPTDNVHNNAGIAFIIFAMFVWIGLTKDAVGFIKHMMGSLTSGPIIIVGLFVFAIECLSFVIRPLSLTLRISGNMYGDHKLFLVMSDLSPDWMPIPAIFLGLALFVSFMQAFIFSLLSSTYIAGSLPHHDDESH